MPKIGFSLPDKRLPLGKSPIELHVEGVGRFRFQKGKAVWLPDVSGAINGKELTWLELRDAFQQGKAYKGSRKQKRALAHGEESR